MADRRLQVFHAVAKQMSFTRAAEVLFMTQPAVTFQIKQLEEHFNTRLFDRGHGAARGLDGVRHLLARDGAQQVGLRLRGGGGRGRLFAHEISRKKGEK